MHDTTGEHTITSKPSRGQEENHGAGCRDVRRRFQGGDRRCLQSAYTGRRDGTEICRQKTKRMYAEVREDCCWYRVMAQSLLSFFVFRRLLENMFNLGGGEGCSRLPRTSLDSGGGPARPWSDRQDCTFGASYIAQVERTTVALNRLEQPTDPFSTESLFAPTMEAGRAWCGGRAGTGTGRVESKVFPPNH